MKTLIVLIGLPASGKSHIARILEKRIKGSYNFDSDLWTKELFEREKIDITKLSYEEQEALRIDIHKRKIDAIKEKFLEYDVILVDTIFELITSWKILMGLEKEGIKLIIVEVVCLEKTAKERILRKKHESNRSVGTKESRLEFYIESRKRWTKPERIDIKIDTDKELPKQIDGLIELI